MNKVVLVGRLTRDPEVRSTSSGSNTARFTVAVNRNFKNKDGQYDGIYMNRLIDGLYTPGSTFKIITAASAIENKKNINQ